MKLIRPLLLASLVSLLSVPAEAQYLWDVGIHAGGANLLGDIGGLEKTRRDFVWDARLGQTRWTFGIFARRKFSRLLSVNAGLLYMRLQGADSFSTNGPRRGRNLNFRNTFPEVYIRPEVTIYQDNDLGGRGRYKTDFRLFGYVGIAGFYHNPQGQVNGEGEFFDLQPLRTEGQTESYENLQLAVPVGIGFHFTKKRRHRFGMDFGWRTTFTDYIDDISTTFGVPNPEDPRDIALASSLANQYIDQEGVPDAIQYSVGTERGDPTHNDSCLTLTFTYSYVLRGQSNFYRQRYSWVRGKKRIGRKSRAKF